MLLFCYAGPCLERYVKKSDMFVQSAILSEQVLGMNSLARIQLTDENLKTR